MWRRQVLLGVMIIALSCARWEKTDEFVNGLRCGMSADEVRQRATTFGAKTHGDPFPPPNLPIVYVSNGETTIECWFSDGRLVATKVWWTNVPTRIKSEPRRELCSSGKAH